MAAGLIENIRVLFPDLRKGFLDEGCGKMLLQHAGKSRTAQQHQRPEIAQSVFVVEPSRDILSNHPAHLKFMIDDADIPKQRQYHHVFHVVTVRVEGGRIAGLAFAEEIRLLHRTQYEHVVVEIDEGIGESFYPVKIQFDGVTAERRKVFPRNVVLMPYDMQLRVCSVESGGQMPPGHEMNGPDPGTVCFDAPEPIPQIIPVAISERSVIYRKGRGILILFFQLLPVRIITIYPDDDEIDVLMK